MNMSIDTNINITDKNHKLLEKNAFKMNITKNELVVKLLTAYLNNQSKNYEVFKRVKYQKKKKHEIWNPIHVWLSPEFYEKCINLRVFHKLSLSNILTLAIQLYLNKIIKGVADNFTKNYIFLYTDLYECPIFIIAWGYPREETVMKLYNLYKKLKD